MPSLQLKKNEEALMGIRRKYIRDLAERLLKKHCPKGVPVDPAKIAKDLGIELRLEKVDDGLSGFLLRDQKNDRVVIGANLRHHPNRRKFTIAHELGHYLLHEAATVHLDERKPGYLPLVRMCSSERQIYLLQNF